MAKELSKAPENQTLVLVTGGTYQRADGSNAVEIKEDELIEKTGTRNKAVVVKIVGTKSGYQGIEVLIPRNYLWRELDDAEGKDTGPLHPIPMKE